MPTFPYLDAQATQRDTTDSFYGYNHQTKIGKGEFYETRNLSTDHTPMLAPRRPRGITEVSGELQGIIEKDALAYVAGGTLYYNGTATPVTGLASGSKQLVSMGAYIIIFPDKVYYNTADGADYGSIEATFSTTGSVSYALCRADGDEYTTPTVSATEPDNPQNLDLWIDTSSTPHVLRQYGSAAGTWAEIVTVYTKLTFSTQGQIPALFAKYDGVTISGASFADANGDKIIYAVGGEADKVADYIVVVGLLEKAYSDETSDITIMRSVPQMDYVCECQNRLWGCYYGNDGTQNLNELYCCALGDFKNWRQYLGLSTDSWTASVGSDGVWTGCVNYLGSPLFFKENRIHRITVSSTGAHRVAETVARGVQRGSGRSLAVVNETLYYKSREDICAYQGGFPTGVSEALGQELYSDAAAGAVGSKYYISMKDKAGGWHLFCFDISKTLWMHEDELHGEAFARVDDELYCIAGGKLVGLLGYGGTREADVSWEAVSGIMYYEYPGNKYISRYDIRLNMAKGAKFEVYIEYDSTGVWQRGGSATAYREGTTSYMFPIRPRRCDHMRLKLCGTGESRVFSIARILEIGSDYR